MEKDFFMALYKEPAKKRRPGKGFLIAAVLAVILAAAVILAVTLFQIRDVEVTGNR